MQKKIGIFLFTTVGLIGFIGLLVAAQQRPPKTNEIPAIKLSVNGDSNAAKTTAEIALGQEIDKTIDEGDSKQARWGVLVKALDDGRVIYARNGDRLFTPASNMKIYTTAVAIDLLGAEYRWRTSVYAGGELDNNGTINGDLILYGRGAPDLISVRRDGFPSLPDLADQLYQRGVRTIRGNIIGDESYFRGEPYGNGWQWNDLQWYFGAEPSALTIDDNAVELRITPAGKIGSSADLELKRQTGFVHLTNNTTTVERGGPITIGINRGLSNNDVRVWGDFPLGGRSFSAYLSVAQPALWAASLFKQVLIARGIKVDGEPDTRDFRTSEKLQFKPQSGNELAHVDGQTLGEIVRATNKASINLNAELLLRTVGKERGVMAPEPDQRKTTQRGDDEAGAAVMKLWLERAGVSTEKLSFRDGSGLSRLDLVSPESTVGLLMVAARTNWFGTFHDSLPVAGKSGTLKPRLLNEAGRIFAKTGSLTFDHSLSGYATTPRNKILVFSILCNDETHDRVAIQTIDRIATLIAAFEP